MLKLARLVLLSLFFVGCGAGTPLLVQCRLTAVSKLPLDNPDAITVGDVKTLAADLKTCQGSADAGPAHQSGKETP
jgi:3-keto-L-gulonate-6-phosphate decarboxylase